MPLSGVEAGSIEFYHIWCLLWIFDTLIIDTHLYVTHGDGRQVITRMEIHVQIPPIEYTCPQSHFFVLIARGLMTMAWYP